jgi:hypothetical protein
LAGFGSFEEILNNFYASYFAGCFLISKKELIEKPQISLTKNNGNPSISKH